MEWAASHVSMPLIGRFTQLRKKTYYGGDLSNDGV